MSATWREAYERYKRVKPTLTRYGSKGSKDVDDAISRPKS